jgi:hypothetical protein
MYRRTGGPRPLVKAEHVRQLGKSGMAAFAACAVLAACTRTSPAHEAEPSVREPRYFRPQTPWWRHVLAAPETGLDALAWPIKRTLFWAEDVNLPARVQDVLYFDDERTAGWFPNFDFGGEISAGTGIRLFHRDLAGADLELSTLFALRNLDGPSFEEGRIAFRAWVPTVGGSPFDVRTQIFFQDDEDDDLFVATEPDGSLRLGRAPDDDDETTYELEQVRMRFQAEGHPAERVTVGLAFVPLVGKVEEGEGGEPPIPSTVDGFGGPTVLLGGGPVIEWDARDASVRPRRGWYARAEGGYWHAVEGRAASGADYRYARYTAELQRHQPTFRPDRTLMFRARLDRVEPVGDDTVPFWDLPVLDQDHMLRAFERNRFRDLGALALGIEYRYPIWDTWDGFLFLDEGQVFHRYSDIAIDRFEWSAGAGIRFYTASGFLFRVQYAVGEEEQDVRFGFQQEF